MYCDPSIVVYRVEMDRARYRFAFTALRLRCDGRGMTYARAGPAPGRLVPDGGKKAFPTGVCISGFE